MTYLNEPINVWAFFKGREIIPYLFIWRNRRIKVEKINLVHESKAATILRHFSVSSGGNYYRLGLDLHDLKWFLEDVEED